MPGQKARSASSRQTSRASTSYQCLKGKTRGWPGDRQAEATPSFGRLCPAMTAKGRSSVRLRRRRGGLRRGLRGAADDDGQQALVPQLLRGLLGVVERHGVNERVALLDVVDRQLV